VPVSFGVEHIPELRRPKAKFMISGLDAPDSPGEGDRSWAHLGNPFADKSEEQEVEAAASGQQINMAEVQEEETDSDHDDEALQADYIDEDAPAGSSGAVIVNRRKKEANKKDGGGPVIVSASMNLMRLIGKYCHMCEVLESVETEAFEGLDLLYDFYVYTVFSAFHIKGTVVMSQTLEEMIQGMRERLRKNPTYGPRLQQKVQEEVVGKRAHAMASMKNMMQSRSAQAKQVEEQFPCPAVPQCELDRADDLYGLTYRFAAVKSLSFLGTVLQAVRPRFEKVVGVKRQTIQNFYAKVDRHDELEFVLFRNIAQSLLKVDNYVDQIAKCKWDTESMEADLKCNDYVHGLISEYRTFFARLNDPQFAVMPDDVRDTLIKSGIETAMQVMVEGFSRAKKCTNEGRVQMSFDLKQLQMGLQDLTKVKPIPGIPYVDEYVKGYFLLTNISETDEVIAWVMKHVHSYSKEQMENLLTVSFVAVNNLKRKAKADLMEAVERTYKELL